MYSMELARVETPHHVLTGGFHFNPKAIELALKVGSEGGGKGVKLIYLFL